MVPYKRFIILVNLLILALVAGIGCAQKNRSVPAEHQVRARYYPHVVTQSGETLGMIAKWYTGSADNWRVILSSNPGLDEKRIKIGSEIMIPAELVTKHRPMPKPSQAVVKQDSTTSPGSDSALPSSEPSSELQHQVESASSQQDAAPHDQMNVPTTANDNVDTFDSPPVIADNPSDMAPDGNFGSNIVIPDQPEKKKGVGSALSNWLTGSVEEPAKDQAPADIQFETGKINAPPDSANQNPSMPPNITAADIAKLQAEAQKSQQEALQLANKAQAQADAEIAKARDMQKQAEAAQGAALSNTSGTAVNPTADDARVKTREQLLKELTEDY